MSLELWSCCFCNTQHHYWDTANESNKITGEATGQGWGEEEDAEEDIFGVKGDAEMLIWTTKIIYFSRKRTQ